MFEVDVKNVTEGRGGEEEEEEGSPARVWGSDCIVGMYNTQMNTTLR